ncbi:MAG: hypothetical protein JWO30_1503 [Fibrobacteres bacterium]|nr:hypothetical protein [Fibrobacterota bacterium]
MFRHPNAKSVFATLALCLSLSASAFAGKPDSTGVAIVPATGKSPSGGKSCEELKSEIDAKLKAKGLKAFTLDILAKDAVKTEKVVGTCESGARKIVYKKG